MKLWRLFQMWKKTSLAILALSLTTAAQAEIEPVFKFGVEVGGDSLVETSIEDMNAGGGLYFGAGINITGDTPDDLIYRATIGYLYDNVEFIQPNGDASTKAIPLNFGIYKQFKSHEFGVGLAYYLNPSYEISADNCFAVGGCRTVDFDNAPGFTAEYNYHFGNSAFAGVKYTSMDYKHDNYNTLDVSSFGIYLGASIK